MSIDHGTPPSFPADLLPHESYTEDPKFCLQPCDVPPSCSSSYSLRCGPSVQVISGPVHWESESGWLPRPRPTPARLSFHIQNSLLTGLLLGLGVDYTKLNYVHPRLVLDNNQVRVFTSFFLSRIGCICLSGVSTRRTSCIVRVGLALESMSPVSIFTRTGFPFSVFDLSILIQQKEASGVAALAMLCFIVLTSVAPSFSGFLREFPSPPLFLPLSLQLAIALLIILLRLSHRSLLPLDFLLVLSPPSPPSTFLSFPLL
ncbi:hypothetical protein MVEN_01121800 [Mycena venus]|uniref:Uncharacterized protein n=1 Tax=Mycena venus TaxID=2733690 RepID=A0A8H6Y525_9AGAR|nr:hypothetical protein MVEN_01121800 [Mycena venus]